MTAPAAPLSEPTASAPAISRPSLVATGLKKQYGRREVVRGVDLNVNPGEIVALFGPNGAGKTTTFYMIVGFIRAGAGHIALGQRDVTALPMHQRAQLGLGYLPQEPSAFRKLSARDNLLAILEYQKLPRAEQERRADALLEEFGLSHLANSFAYQLSGGERRRLELARALTTDPDYLLLDEPFTGVDPKSIREIQRLIRELRDRRGIGVFITDHNVRETIALTDRVYLMFDGQVTFQGTPAEFAANPDVRAHYLGEDFEL
ncbi:Sulfate-transporting ATPase [Deinococcus proteolyticus MRP]|uniref:Sulfate-transporting ATPase n=1 Tax=Deinococcus proteolyticus (strain ATCC 35074 / DSM 20540 / JCM 6276 / NBRC 101906 / NCIMB 13154 / VKM Ac-1939 / CCM 2703 / MRP) TaxID=693977 RepID=F0RLI6_DEIPM|nr:LPS export ABC transporter ATP-binding protein [Deinococcus sp. SL84]ADY26910.1 Sulfate-transporting ATPase [Deinococcus proteolyticus MRP]